MPEATNDDSGSGAIEFDAPSKRAQDLLLEWLLRVRINIDAHNAAERFYAYRNAILTVASISSLVILGVAATAFELDKGLARWLALGLSLLGASTSALQGVLNYGASALANRQVARQFGVLRRSIELALNYPDKDKERAISEIARQWDIVSSGSENVPQRIRDKARARRRSAPYIDRRS